MKNALSRCLDESGDETGWLAERLSVRGIVDIISAEKLFRSNLFDALAEDLKKELLEGAAPTDWSSAANKMLVVKEFRRRLGALARSGGRDLVDKDNKDYLTLSWSKFHRSKLSFFEWFPIINTFYDLLFDEAPTVEQIKDLLATMVLILGLLFGSTTGLYSAVNFQEMQDQLRRFSDPTWVGWSFCEQTKNIANLIEPSEDRCAGLINGGIFNPKYNFGNFDPNVNATNNYASVKNDYGASWTLAFLDSYPAYTNLAMGCIGLGLLLSTCTYLFITTSSFSLSSSDFDEDAEESAHLVQAWWIYCRWIVLFCFLMFVTGVLNLVFAYVTLGYIKFPNKAIEMNVYFWQTNDLIGTGPGVANKFGWTYCVVIFLSWVLFSMGLANKYRVKQELSWRGGEKKATQGSRVLHAAAAAAAADNRLSFAESYPTSAYDQQQSPALAKREMEMHVESRARVSINSELNPMTHSRPTTLIPSAHQHTRTFATLPSPPLPPPSRPGR